MHSRYIRHRNRPASISSTVPGMHSRDVFKGWSLYMHFLLGRQSQCSEQSFYLLKLRWMNVHHDWSGRSISMCYLPSRLLFK